MSVYFSKKCRLCRASKEKLFLKGERCLGKCPLDRKGAVPPGQHGVKGRRKTSDYGVRLLEKQKLKRIYGITERQMKKIFTEARRTKGLTGEIFLQILESRLDNLIYRFGFSPSRRLARQLVSHRHVLVNGKVVNIPSYRLKVGQVVTLSSKALAMDPVKAILKRKELILPSWLERHAVAGKISRPPKREEINININEQLVIEYYSR